MANYNPSTPLILGQEWVPIRDEDLVLDPFSNSLERGYGFTLDAPTTVNNVRFYINEFPPLFVRDQGYTANIYPRGAEADAGPVGRVVIPCNAGSLDAPNANLVTSPSGSSVPEVVYNPSGNYFLNWNLGTGTYSTANFWFATNSYAQLLSGKRILGINLLTGINVVGGATANPDDFAPTFAGWLYPILTNDAQYLVSQADGFVFYRPLVTFQTPTNTRVLIRTRMGDADLAYGTNGPFTSGTPNITQWTYQELQRLESSAGANRLFVSLHSTGAAGSATVLVLYVALEVFYCEERRVAFGTRNINGLRFVQARDPFQLGMNQIVVRNPAGTTNPTLAAGNYTVTLSEANTGDNFTVAYSPFQTAKVNELRQLYEISTVPGVQVNLPFPLTEEAVGTVLTKESTDLIPQLSLHGSSLAVLTPSHSYGRQAAGQVWGTNYVSQDIDDSAISSGTSYPYIRYYARKFGNTTIPLTVETVGPGAGMLLPAGISTGRATTPDVAALDITGDIELRADAALIDWGSSATQVLVSKWPTAGAGNAGSSYRLAIDSGAIQLVWSTTGTDLGAASSIPIVGLPAIGTGRLAVAVQLDVNNGAGGKDIRFYTAPTMSGSWTQLGPTQTQAGTTSIFSSSTNVAVGANADGTERSTGTFYAAQILNGVPAGTAVANPNFAAQAPGTTSFVDAAGRTWTINSPASIIAGLSTASSASITPTEFDALDEILDGWKEVRLRLATAPSIGGGMFPRLRWTSAGEAAGSRWEILGTSAFAASGIAQQMAINLQLGQVPVAQQLYASTYSAPTNGAGVNMEWLPQMGPYVSGSAVDLTADVAVILSQEPPAVSGFTIASASQAISGIGKNCGIDPCGIPTHILYNRLRWNPYPASATTTSMYLPGVAGSYASTPDAAALDITGDIDLQFDATMNWFQPTASSLVAKWNETTNNRSYLFFLSATGTLALAWSTNGSSVVATPNSTMPVPVTSGRLAVRATLDVNNGAAGWTANFYVASTIAGPWIPLGAPVVTAGVTSIFSGSALGEIGAHTGGTMAPLNGSVNSAKIINGIGGTEVANPNFAAQSVGTTSFADATGKTWTLNGAAAIVATQTNPNHLASVELQRSDEITEWATIMDANTLSVTGFSDYEARVGMNSNYRIRYNGIYDFHGPWSSTLTINTASPGVSGSCLSDAHLMIFTTNERQDGSSNLAYSNAWEGEVEEGFSFAEAGFTQLQPMYDRNFFTAFRPSERGGEQFSRALLVQAAAIAPPTLGDFRSLRNMAWDSVPYICVRDEDGNRWFANINVPDGVVQNRRRLYMATVQIVEVTDTPSPVDP